MNKTNSIVIITLLLIFAVSCKPVEKVALTPENINPLTNAVDSMSYALGMNMGKSLSNDLVNIPGGKSNKDLIIKGFSASLKSDSTLFDAEMAQNYFTEYLKEQQMILNEKMKKEGEDFLAQNKAKEDVKVTESGLQYIVLKQIEGEKPKATDRVKVHYTGWTIDGKVFDSSVERGQPAEFALDGVIKGWTEGVQLMSVGSKYKFFIPYDLAYGERGIPQAGIKPYAPLIFEVELLEILK